MSILVNIIVVSIQEISVTHYQVQHGVGVIVWLRRITAKYIENGASIVKTRGDLAVAIIVILSARIG